MSKQIIKFDPYIQTVSEFIDDNDDKPLILFTNECRGMIRNIKNNPKIYFLRGNYIPHNIQYNKLIIVTEYAEDVKVLANKYIILVPSYPILPRYNNIPGASFMCDSCNSPTFGFLYTFMCECKNYYCKFCTRILGKFPSCSFCKYNKTDYYRSVPGYKDKKILFIHGTELYESFDDYYDVCVILDMDDKDKYIYKIKHFLPHAVILGNI